MNHFGPSLAVRNAYISPTYMFNKSYKISIPSRKSWSRLPQPPSLNGLRPPGPGCFSDCLSPDPGVSSFPSCFKQEELGETNEFWDILVWKQTKGLIAWPGTELASDFLDQNRLSGFLQAILKMYR